jgi:hypothetical protein
MGNVLALEMIKDVQSALVAANWPNAATQVVATRSPCLDITVSGQHAAAMLMAHQPRLPLAVPPGALLHA